MPSTQPDGEFAYLLARVTDTGTHHASNTRAVIFAVAIISAVGIAALFIRGQPIPAICLVPVGIAIVIGGLNHATLTSPDRALPIAAALRDRPDVILRCVRIDNEFIQVADREKHVVQLRAYDGRDADRLWEALLARCPDAQQIRV